MGAQNGRSLVPPVDHLSSRTRDAAVIGLAIGGSAAVGLVLGTGNLLLAGGVVAIAALSVVYRSYAVLMIGLALGMYLAGPTLAWPVQPVRVLWAVVLVMIGITLFNVRHLALRPGALLPAVLVASPLMAGFFHLQNASSLRSALYPLIALAGGIWLFTTFAQSKPDRFRQMLTWFVWGTTALALLAVYQRAVGYWPVIDDLTNATSAGSAAYPDRSGAIFGHPVVYAGVAQVAAFVALLVRPRWWQVAFAMNALGVLLSGSRSAWIGFALMLVSVLLLQVGGRLPGAAKLWQMALTLAICVGIAVVLAPAAAESVSSGISERISGADSSIGVDARANRIDQGWAAIVHPNGPDGSRDLATTLFGYGPNAAAIYWARSPAPADRGAPTFDNTYITWLYDYGLVGLAWIAAAFLAIAWRSNWAGRILILGLLWDIWAYVATGWPVTLLLLALAAGVGRMQPRRSARGAAV